EAPVSRPDMIRQRFRPDVLITSSMHLPDITARDPATRVVLVDALADAELMDARRPADLAYLMFTSGSTGVPQGVMIPLQAPAHLGTLKQLFFCGEALLKQHVDAVFAALPNATVSNIYGPTEATVSCTQQRLTRDDYLEHCDTSVAIGPAIAGMHIELVNGP